MSLTAAQAIDLLSDPKYQTPEGLLNLVRQVSVATSADKPGATTLLYSGNMLADGSGPSTQSIAEYISKNHKNQIRVIDSTEVAKFLTNTKFADFLKEVIPDQKIRTAWLYDATKGPWAVASEAFVRGAQGPIETFSSFASAHRTFSVIEVPVALDTPTITTIGGLKRQDLVDYRASLVQKTLGQLVTC